MAARATTCRVSVEHGDHGRAGSLEARRRVLNPREHAPSSGDGASWGERECGALASTRTSSLARFASRIPSVVA